MRLARIAPLLLMLAVVLAACGGSAATSSTSSTNPGAAPTEAVTAAPTATAAPSATATATAGTPHTATLAPSAAPRTQSPATPAPTAAPPPSPAVPHVLVIIEENREYGDVIGSSSAPYVNSLAQQYGLATSWYGVSHPSLPNYLAMISGSTQGVTDDGTGYVFSGPTFVDQLAAKGVSWKAYMEDMPSPCFNGGGSGGYAKKHDPFMYFSSITSSPAQCARVVPFSQFGSDLSGGSLPSFAFVSPNQCNDGHDCNNATMDSWLQSHLAPVLSSGWFAQGGVVVLTWDEGSSSSGCCSGSAGGHIATIVVAHDNLSAHQLTSNGDHYGMLRALEDAYGVSPLGSAGAAGHGTLRTLF